ncbi:MAG: leucine-rich repeat domain-containing protein [Bacteroidales bacterium]|nr:leucine-rich repeat domain-containing protein [Bacteroidales bacterium]
MQFIWNDGSGDHITVQPTAGAAGETTLQVSSDANATSEDRSLDLTILYGNNRLTLPITQEAKCPDNEVWYWAPEKVTLYTSTGVQSHTFENGKGVLTFSGNVTTVSAWFRAITTITAVRVPDTVKTIAANAFYGCTAMTCSFVMPSLTSLGSLAFRGSGITSFSAPLLASVPGTQYNPAEGAFALCSNLRSVSLPACTSIGYYAFKNCTSLTSAYIPVVKTIQAYAFNGCTSLTGDFSLTSLTSLGNWSFRGTKITSFSAPLLTSVPGQMTNNAYGPFTSITTLHTVNLPVCTSIGAAAFQGCSALTSLSIPAVKTISENAFNGCSSLIGDFSLPALTSLGNLSFRGTKITSFSAPLLTSVPGQLTNNAYGPFTNITTLHTVNLPVCTSIGAAAFRGCSALASLNIPAVKTISDQAFNACSSLAGDMEFLALTSLGNLSFRGTKITSFSAPLLTSVPGQLTNNTYGPFTNITTLQSVNLPSCKTINAAAFRGCTGLRTINMPSVATLGRYAFYNCTSLIGDFDLPYLTSIDYEVFSASTITSFKAKSLGTLSGHSANPAAGLVSNCKQLTRVEFPSVSAVQYNAFRADSKLEEIDFSGYTRSTIPTIQYSAANNPFYGCASNYQILIPKSLEAAWKAASGWSSIASHIVGEVIPSNEIWYYADSQVTLYDSTDVSTHTFNDGKGVITLNGDITSVKQWLRGTAVERIKLPVDVVTIEDYAFAGCTSLLGVVNTIQVTAVGAHAFDGCTALQNVNITSIVSNAVTIGDYAFANSSATSVTIPVTVTSLGDGVFSGCASMTTFTMTAGGIATISDNMFEGCVKLATVTIPDVTQIGTSAFEGCVLLASIAMPAVLSIGASAFKDCVILATIDFSAKADTTIPTIGTDALSGIDASFVVNVPAALETDWQADANWSSLSSHVVGV